MYFTKRERELQQQQSLEQYKELVVKEAKKRLENASITKICTNHLSEIKCQTNFESDVESIVLDSMLWN